jgi:hypothetical protein
MKPLLLADWAYINRLFRGAMWLVALALACAIVAFATLHGSSSGAGTRSAAPAIAPSPGAVAANRPHQ